MLHLLPIYPDSTLRLTYWPETSGAVMTQPAAG